MQHTWSSDDRLKSVLFKGTKATFEGSKNAAGQFAHDLKMFRRLEIISQIPGYSFSKNERLGPTQVL